MTSNRYNGYANRATWNAVLWLTGDYNIYRSMTEFFKNNPASKENVQFFCYLLWPCSQTPDGDELADVYWPEVMEVIGECCDLTNEKETV